MGADSIEDVLWEQFGFEIAEPEVFPETVAGDGFDAAAFTVGIGIVYRAVDEVIEICEDTQGTGQPVIAVPMGPWQMFPCYRMQSHTSASVQSRMGAQS